MNKEDKNNIASIDEYISHYAADMQVVLQELRETIRNEAPLAIEKISYQMPTFYLKGNLIHFAVQKNHIGLYPAPSGVEEFRQEFVASGYKYSKGAVQFPIGKPLPLDLIRRIVRFRLKEQLS